MRVMVIVCIWVAVACSGRGEKQHAGPRLRVVYSIDLDRAIDDKAAALQRDLEAAFADEKIAATAHVPSAPRGALTLTPSDPSSNARIEQLVKSNYGDTVVPITCDAAAAPRAICFKIGAEYAEAVKKSALAAAVGTIRQRLVDSGVSDPTVVEKAGQIIVEFPVDDQRGVEIRDRIARAGKLEMKVVDSGSEFMQRVYARVGAEGKTGVPTDPAARTAEIRAEIDQWRADDGGSMFTDYYLIASDRQETLTAEQAKAIGCLGRDVVDGKVACTVTGRVVLERYLAELSAADPSFKVPDDREIGFELAYPLADAVDKRPYWRSYYLERAVRITGSAIAKAEGITDPNTDRPLVLLDFNRHGAQQFGELTAQIVGKKLATIVDGRIKNAPIINGPITGGRASITMTAGDQRSQERERDDLVNALKTGALPAPLREESVSVTEPLTKK